MKKSYGTIDTVSGKGLRVGIVVSRFNREISARLLQGAEKTLKLKGVARVEIVWVPGAIEIPVMLKTLAARKKFDAFIALGVVIRGGTPHFDSVCEGAIYGVMNVMLETGVPIAFGILTTDNVRQAVERAGGRHGNKGSEAALVAIEMGNLVKNG